MTAKITSAWFVYLLECRNGKIYTGIATDVDARFNTHLAGKGAKFTKMNPPSHLIASKQCENRSEASKLEYQIKQLTPAKKRALSVVDTTNDLMTMRLKLKSAIYIRPENFSCDCIINAMRKALC
jgi:putative endonuclease